MPIISPDTQTLDLTHGRGSAIEVGDTYHKPAINTNDGGLSQLGDALGKLGVNVSGFANSQDANKEKLDAMNVDYYANNVSKDLTNNGPVDVQLGKLLPEQSPTIRGLVAQEIGNQRGSAAGQEAFNRLSGNPDLFSNPDAFNTAVESERQKAREAVAGNPAFGAGYYKAFNAQLDKAQQTATTARTGWLQDKSGEALQRTALDNAQKAYDGSQIQYGKVGDTPEKFPALTAALPSGKSPESITNLNANFGSRLNQMIADAPADIRPSLTIVSGFRSNERQQQLFDAAVEKYGSPEAARKWVAPAGASIHNHGEAVDLGSIDGKFGDTPAGKWVHDNAAKYGLFFPMAHEPWHIEMQDGVRNSKNLTYHGGDQGDTSNPVDNLTNRILTQSNVEGFGKNPNSSADGYGQFTARTWATELSKTHPELTNGRSVDDLAADPKILALRQDKNIAGSTLKGFTQGNADKLTAAGLPVNESNLYTMQFAGEGDGPKILRASDGAKLNQVMSPASLEANPFLQGMTVGEFKQFTASKAGTATDGISAAQNSIRSDDRTFSRISGLNNPWRRDLVSKALISQAIATGDTKYLQMMPPEMLTPDVQSQMAAARRQVADIAWKDQQRKMSDDANAKAKAFDDGKQEIWDTLTSDKQVDLRKYIGNKDLYDFAQKESEANYSLSDTQSLANMGKIQNGLENAGLTGDYSRLLGQGFKGKDATYDDVSDFVTHNPNLKPTQKQALLAGIKPTMDRMAMVNTPTVQDYYSKFVGADVADASKNIMVKLGQSLSPVDAAGFHSRIRDSFNTAYNAKLKAWSEDHNGNLPTGQANLDALEYAGKSAKDALKSATENMLNGKPADAKTPITPPSGQFIEKDGKKVWVEGEAKAAPAAKTSDATKPEGIDKYVPTAKTKGYDFPEYDPEHPRDITKVPITQLTTGELMGLGDSLYSAHQK